MFFYAICRSTSTGWSGFFPSLPGCVATGKDIDKLKNNLAESLTLHLLDMAEDGERVPTSDDKEELYWRKKYPNSEIISVEPVEVNPLSIEIGKAIEETGKSLRELEKETGIGYTVLSRLQDPFYWGHSLKSVLAFAKALKLKPSFSFSR